MPFKCQISSSFPVALFGAMKAGLVVVNTNPLYTEREMLHQFRDSEARAIVILANFAKQLENILDQTPDQTGLLSRKSETSSPLSKKFVVNNAVKYVKKMVPDYSLPQAHSFLEAP